MAGKTKILPIGMLAALIAFGAAPVARADLADAEQSGAYFGGQAAVGYRAVHRQEQPGRAGEYTLLESGPTAAVQAGAFSEHRHFYLDADLTGADDYSAQALFDYKGLLRLNLRGMGMVHNLDHFPFDEARRPDALDPDLGAVVIDDADPGDRYRYDIDQQSVRFRGKYPGLPAHLNLGYWRWERQGRQQLRFVDENCASCHLQSRSREVDRVTEEVTASVDAHLGPIDLEFEQLLRRFEADEPIPVDTFGNHDMRPGPANFQHDEVPDSRLTVSTARAHTSLSGGVVGAVSYAFGTRENRSDLGDVQAKRPEVEFQKGAGDLTWIPSPRVTVHLRYRLLDLEEDRPEAIVAEGLSYQGVERGGIAVRPGIDLTRAYYQGTLAWRPLRPLTIKGEFSRQEVHRDHTGGPEPFDPFVTPIVADLVWELPEDETISTYRLSLLGRWGKGGRNTFQGWYELSDSSDPAYGNSSDRQHRGFAGMVWRGAEKWGGSANLGIGSGTNDEFRIFTAADGEFRSFDLDRSTSDQSATLGLWAQPAEAVHLGLHYGFLRKRIDQDVLFGFDPALGWSVEDEHLDYRQQMQTLSGTCSWRLNDRLEVLGEIAYVLAKARFDPAFAAMSLPFATGEESFVERTVTAEGLREKSEVDLREWALNLGLNWQLSQDWSCTARFTLKDYEDREDDFFDGQVQTYSVALARSW